MIDAQPTPAAIQAALEKLVDDRPKGRQRHRPGLCLPRHHRTASKHGRRRSRRRASRWSPSAPWRKRPEPHERHLGRNRPAAPAVSSLRRHHADQRRRADLDRAPAPSASSRTAKIGRCRKAGSTAAKRPTRAALRELAEETGTDQGRDHRRDARLAALRSAAGDARQRAATANIAASGKNGSRCASPAWMPTSTSTIPPGGVAARIRGLAMGAKRRIAAASSFPFKRNGLRGRDREFRGLISYRPADDALPLRPSSGAFAPFSELATW